MYSRRKFLKYLGAGAVTWLAAQPLMAAPRTPRPNVERLRTGLTDLIGRQEVGLDLRRMDKQHNTPEFQIQVNADKLYPVASCFKMFLLLYYFWHTPESDWLTHRESAAYRTAVFSDNLMTAYLLSEVAERISVFGNPIEKFNDFLIFTLGMSNGLHRWNWEGSPTENMTDPRFAPSRDRAIFTDAGRYEMDNLFATQDLAYGYDLLLNPQRLTDYPQAEAAIQATLDILSIPAVNYEAPFERAFGTAYTGKDGVLRPFESAVGGVLNDAGILEVGEGRYIMAFMSAGLGEFHAMNLLREMANEIKRYESLSI